MHKFGGRDGRVLTVSINGGASKNDRDNTKYSLTRYLNPDSTSQLNQLILNHSKGYRVGGRVSYSEPVSERVQLLANYDISYNYSDRDKRSYELPGDLFLDSLSNTYNSGYLTHRVGPGFRLHSDKTMLVVNLNYQYATLTGDQQFPTVSRSKMAANFDNIVYRAMLHLKFNRSNSMRVRLFSGTDNPSVTQLQNVLDVSNPLFISQGNPNLKPVYAQRMNIRYTRVNVGKGTTLGAQMTAGIQNNSITNSVERADRNGYEVKDETGNTVVVLDRGAQYSRPVNLNGYYTLWMDKSVVRSSSMANGDYARVNLSGVDARHMGLELDFVLRPNRWLDVTGMLSLGDWQWDSDSKGYIYDTQGQPLTKALDGTVASGIMAEDHAWLNLKQKGIKVGGSAQTTGALGVTVRPMKGLRVSADWNAYGNNYADFYIGSQTSLSGNSTVDVKDPWKIPWGHQLDLSASYAFKIGNVRATIYGNVNNVYDYNYIMDAQCAAADEGIWQNVYAVMYSFGRTYTVRLKINF